MPRPAGRQPCRRRWRRRRMAEPEVVAGGSTSEGDRDRARRRASCQTGRGGQPWRDAAKRVGSCPTPAFRNRPEPIMPALMNGRSPARLRRGRHRQCVGRRDRPVDRGIPRRTHGLAKGSMTLVEIDRLRGATARSRTAVEMSGSAANTVVGSASFGGGRRTSARSTPTTSARSSATTCAVSV